MKTIVIAAIVAVVTLASAGCSGRMAGHPDWAKEAFERTAEGGAGVE